MRKITLFITLVFVCFGVNAQINLVHNPSFESFWRCPRNIDRVKDANFWSSTNDTLSSDTLSYNFCAPQYCNTCSDYYKVTIPNSWFYSHYPRTGNGMMHMNMYFNGVLSGYLNQRDYLQGRLEYPLVLGNQYCITFYVALAGASAYASNKIGAYLDDGTIDTTVNCGFVQSMYIPQLIENAVITDTANWTKIQGSFTAIGNEKFITIGNFSVIEDVDSLATNFARAALIGNIGVGYYLVDDVSVIKVGTVAFAGNDTTIYEGDTAWLGEHVNYVGDSVWHSDFDDYAPVKWYTVTGALIDSNHSGLMVHPTTTTKYVMELDVCGTLTYDTVTVTVIPVGIDGVKTLGAVKVYPNPATNVVHVSGLAAGCSYKIVNAVGLCVGQGQLLQKQEEIDIARLPKGVYLLELLPADGNRAVIRLVKQ